MWVDGGFLQGEVGGVEGGFVVAVAGVCCVGCWEGEGEETCSPGEDGGRPHLDGEERGSCAIHYSSEVLGYERLIDILYVVAFA